jgi:catechol 2,3-dioxygenase-like lactoylglutathione lyase family enzyme
MSCLGLEGTRVPGGKTMHLNHLDLQVTDVQAHAAFFERFFDFVHRSNRASPAIAILEGDGGFTLVLQRKKRDDERYPEGFHVGFVVDDVGLVEDARARLVAGGAVVSDVIVNGRGTMIYCETPDGILVEVSTPKRRDEPRRVESTR